VMDMPKTLFEAFNPKLFVQNPVHNAMEVARIQSWNLIGHEERTNFRLAVLQALTTCGPRLFVQKMEIFLNELKYRRDEFARMMLEYNDDWKRHNIHAQMAAILGQQQPVAALAGPAMGQANTPYIPQRPPWTLPRGRPDSTYASDRLAQPEVHNPYETSALYPQVPQAVPRQTLTYMKLPGQDKIPDWEAGPNPRSAKTGPAKLDSSLFSMEFLSKPALKNKPMPEASFKPKPEPPAKQDPVALEALICQAKDEAVREFKDSMVAPAAGFMKDIQERFKKVKDILQEYHDTWAEVNGELPMNQEQETTMAGLLNRFKGVCCEIMTENHAVAIAAQELVDTVTGTGGAGVQDDSKVVSSDPDDNDETMEQDGGVISDDENDDKDKPLVGTSKGTSKAKNEGMRKVASQGNPNKGRALGVPKVIRKHARPNTGAKDNTGPAKRGPAKKVPAKLTPDPVKPLTDTAKPATDPAKPPTDAMMLEDIKLNTSWD